MLRPALFDLGPADLTVSIDDHVRWGDMDAFGHMNNIVFFQMFESARMAYFENIEFGDPKLNGGIGPILAHTDCHFRRPLAYPQALKIGARIAQLEEDRFTMEYAIFAANDTPALAACGTGKVICYDYNLNKRTVLPSHITARISSLESADI